MGLFGSGKIKAENKRLVQKIRLEKIEKAQLAKRVKELEKLSDAKDIFFKELMSDALRHGSSLAGKHMSDYKKIIKK